MAVLHDDEELAKYADAARAAKDLAAWKEWDSSGRKPAALRPLLTSFRPMLQFQAGVYKGRVRIPPAAIDAEYQKQFLKAVETYDPNRGVALGTHVFGHLKAARRFITSHQDLARIPETRVYKIRKFKQAHQELGEQFGREPSEKEMAHYLRWNVKELVRMKRSVRKDLFRSRFEEDPIIVRPTAAKTLVTHLPGEFTGRERKVIERIFAGKGTGQIAGELKTAPSVISRMRKRIAERAKGYGA